MSKTMPQISQLITTDIAPDTKVSGITSDSRKIKPGFLFFAIKGKTSDGHEYIEQAIKNGAVYIIGEKDLKLSVPYKKSKNIRLDLANAAAKFYPDKPKNIAVVTGTNGKTSTADFTRQLWELLGYDAGSIGTLGLVHNGQLKTLEADNTSPDPVVLNEILTTVKDAAVIEGSSIGLEQYRLDGLDIKAAGFTNFTRDHLDYHATMEEYFDRKTQLFTRVMKKGTAVLNTDIAEFGILKEICEEHGHKIISFGKKGDLKFIGTKPEHDGQTLSLEVYGKKSEHKLNIVGKFQAENILCALGLVIGCGEKPEKVIPLLEKLKSIPGRMEQAAPGIYVDYAHTPDALENAIKALRPHTTGKLHLVFGCGGDRDKGKRPEMGKIAQELADVVIVTDDNPRTEVADEIRKQILAKAPKAVEIGNREQAIKHAVSNLDDGDVLLIAGKGHEKYQIIGKEKQHFDDVEVVRKSLG